MNRLVDLSQKDRLTSSRYEQPHFELRWKDDRQLSILSEELDSGRSVVLIPYTDLYNRIFPVNYAEWTIDLDYQGIDNDNKIGGLIDTLSLEIEQTYFIWSFADQILDAQGFGVSAIPSTQFQTPGATKGNSITLTNLTLAYRFTAGARIRIEPTAAEWNLATISSIDSATQITAVLDNNQVFGATYGTNISAQGATGGLITQLDKYRPFKALNSDQDTIFPYFRLVGILKTDSTAAPNTLIEGFSKYPIITDEPLNSRIVWDGTLTGIFPLLTEDWQFTSGQTCMIDNSPFIGQTLPTIAAPVEIIKVR